MNQINWNKQNKGKLTDITKNNKQYEMRCDQYGSILHYFIVESSVSFSSVKIYMWVFFFCVVVVIYIAYDLILLVSLFTVFPIAYWIFLFVSFFHVVVVAFVDSSLKILFLIIYAMLNTLLVMAFSQQQQQWYNIPLNVNFDIIKRA